MEYVTGIITKTSDDNCVVSVIIQGRQRSFSFSKTIFFVFGMKFDGAGSMANIVEEGMEVELFYKISRTNKKPCIIAVWFGDKPYRNNAFPENSPAVYDQSGRVSYYVDSDNFLVQSYASNYTVIINMDAVYRDGCRLRDIKGMVAIDEKMKYDATPLDGEHLTGASFQATCAWVGEKAPGLVDRFDLLSKESCVKDCEVADVDVYGTVVTIPNDVIAIVDVQLKEAAVKVLLFRSSFETDCHSIREVVDVGDRLCMWIGHGCIFSSRKQFFALRALKPSEEVVDVEAQNCLTEICAIEDNDKTENGETKGSQIFVTKGNENTQCVATKHECALTVETGKAHCAVTKVKEKTESGVTEGKQNLKNNDVTALPATHVVACNTNEVNVGLTKHFNHVRRRTVTGHSLLCDKNHLPDGKAENVTESTVRNYVGVGVKSIKCTEGVKEVIEVSKVIPTYSDVLLDRCNNKTDKPESNVTDSNVGLAYLKKNGAKKRSPVADVSTELLSNGLIRASEPPVKIGSVTDMPVDAKQGRSCKVVTADNLEFIEGDCSANVAEEIPGDFVVLKEFDIVDNNKVTANAVESLLLKDSPLLYCDPPLKGVISRFALDCGCITFKNFKIFVKHNNFYIDGVLSPVKYFIKFAKPGKSMVNFEAVIKGETSNSEFTHEAICAWVGPKPSLIAFLTDMPPPKLSLLELPKQDFCGVVSKLHLPNFALVVIRGDATTVVVHVNSFVMKPQYSVLGNLISDFVKLNDNLIFKVKALDSKSKLLMAWDVRTAAEHLPCKQPAASEKRFSQV